MDDKGLGKGFRQASVMQNMIEREKKGINKAVYITVAVIIALCIFFGFLYMIGALQWI